MTINSNQTKKYIYKQNTVILKGRPFCSEHGAMNKVSKNGLWRCLTCHVGFDEQRAFLKDSTEGFVKQWLIFCLGMRAATTKTAASTTTPENSTLAVTPTQKAHYT